MQIYLHCWIRVNFISAIYLSSRHIPLQIPDRPTGKTGKAIVETFEIDRLSTLPSSVGSTATVIRSTQFRQFTGMTLTPGAIGESDRVWFYRFKALHFVLKRVVTQQKTKHRLLKF
ncbi:hypothetical protein [Microcoleus vaginatus]|uniref:hypothetical protein n=1 Tax=Microcoleus vaginatus TaxID=119532 RepID=UPI001F6034E0